MRVKKGWKKGQGMVEYILIVVGISLAAIVLVRVFGAQVQGYWQSAVNAIRGGEAPTVQQAEDSDGIRPVSGGGNP